MATKKILITGGTGLVGSTFKELTQRKKGRYEIVSPTHNQMDITKKLSVYRFINEYKPEIVVNFAAHRNANTAQAQIHKKNLSAWQTNVVGASNIAKICDRYGIYLIHISTDMVFGGSSTKPGPYKETDRPILSTKLLSWYGYTKLLAERRVVKTCNYASIVRIANVTKPTTRPDWDYLGKICYLYENDKLYPLFNDQWITLTYLPALVRVLDKLTVTKQKGYYHVASDDLASPFDIGEYVLYKKYGVKNVVKASSIDSYLVDDKNRYPKFGGLSAVLTNKVLDEKPLSWRQIVDKFASSVDNIK